MLSINNCFESTGCSCCLLTDSKINFVAVVQHIWCENMLENFLLSFQISSLVNMGQHFGELAKVRHIITYSLSPFEQRAFPNYFSKGIPNVWRRITSSMFRVAPREFLCFCTIKMSRAQRFALLSSISWISVNLLAGWSKFNVNNDCFGELGTFLSQL